MSSRSSSHPRVGSKGREIIISPTAEVLTAPQPWRVALGSSLAGTLSKAVLCSVIACCFPHAGGAVIYSFGPEESPTAGDLGGLDRLERARPEGWTFLKLADANPGTAGFVFREAGAEEVTNEEKPPELAADTEDTEESGTVATKVDAAEAAEADENGLAPEDADSALRVAPPNPPSIGLLSFSQNPGIGQPPTFVTPPQLGQAPGLGNYISNNPGASFGFDPNTHYANDPISFQASNVSPTPEASTLLPLVGVLLMAGGLRRFRRAA